MIKHKHHIIPRHAGGSDDPSNIIELTIEEHAEAHRLLFEKYGRQEDRWAWLGLSGQIDKQELMRELAMSQKGKKKPEGFGLKISKANIGKTHTEETKQKMSAAHKINTADAEGVIDEESFEIDGINFTRTPVGIVANGTYTPSQAIEVMARKMEEQRKKLYKK